MIAKKLFLILFATALAALTACGGGSSSTQSKPTRERFDEAMKELEDEDYQRASELFDVIVTQDPAGDLADDAQFYLGESHFRNEDYRLAQFHYRRLLSSFPSSPYYRQAMYQAAEAAYNLSPPFDRDQTDTENAIKQFRVFVDLYPGDSLSGTARARIAELRNKLAEKEVAIAGQYVKLQEYASALIYFQKVIDIYPDTDYYRLSVEGKVDMLRKLGREAEAAEETQKYRDTNPGATLRNQTN